MQETQVQSIGREDALEKEMATHTSILAWETPWTEEPGGHSPWGHKRAGHDLVTKWQDIIEYSLNDIGKCHPQSNYQTVM